MNSGSMCEHSGNMSASDRLGIVAEWQTYWSAEKLFLVEKSPHFSLKIPCLRAIFGEARSVRFIVMIKHPVTLNTATPRNHGWKYMSVNRNGVKLPVDQRTQLISDQQRLEAVSTFLELMLLDSSSVFSYEHPKCALGWIPAMTRLHQLLDKDPLSRIDVRIVRYEEFVNPLQVCNRLFQFAFSGHMQSNDSSFRMGTSYRGKTHQMLSSRLCHNHFSPKVLALAASKPQSKTDQLRSDHFNTREVIVKAKKDELSRSTNKRVSSNPHDTTGRNRNDHNTKNGSSTVPLHHRRQLRLRTIYDNLVFMPELVSDNGLKRIRDFMFSYQQLNNSMKYRLMKVDKELKLFGYSLFTWYDSSTKVQQRSDGSNKFQPWEMF